MYETLASYSCPAMSLMAFCMAASISLLPAFFRGLEYISVMKGSMDVSDIVIPFFKEVV